MSFLEVVKFFELYTMSYEGSRQQTQEVNKCVARFHEILKQGGEYEINVVVVHSCPYPL